MRLEHLTSAHVRRAAKIYFAHAWRHGTDGKPRIGPEALEGAETLDELFGRFEKADDDDGMRCRRYTLRMGNSRYPFMKFVVQEYLVNGEFFFSVDTHDNLEIRPGAPDFQAWEELKRHNRELKRHIEEEWNVAGLPTHQDLRLLVEELAQIEREAKKPARLLLVDDEREVALGLMALLEARGYDVELAHDGREALDRLERDPVPDLILLDYEMPELDGEEVLARVRRNPRLEDVPVLMATASNIELDRLQRVSGLLRKPYPRHVLFAMIARLLADAAAESGAKDAGSP